MLIREWRGIGKFSSCYVDEEVSVVCLPLLSSGTISP
jgi:hypothetical protein